MTHKNNTLAKGVTPTPILRTLIVGVGGDSDF